VASLELVDVGTDRALLDVFGDLTLELMPEWSRSTEQMLSALVLDPTLRRVVAMLGGEPVGFVSVGRIWVLPINDPTAWCELGVRRSYRRQGIGSQLLAWAEETAPLIGRSRLQLPCRGDRPEGIEFLQHRDFTEYDRMACVELPLAGVVAPPIELPEGVRISSLAAEPELRLSAYETAVEIFADLPDPEPVSAGSFEEWRMRDVDIPDGPLDGYLLAVVGDEVIGYCRLVNAERGVVGEGSRRHSRLRRLPGRSTAAHSAWPPRTRLVTRRCGGSIVRLVLCPHQTSSRCGGRP
jgi:GNAT superfamily N-acetyltransferase